MNKIFKKSLALTVSAALCLTAFIGCLSVSAETVTPVGNITIGSAEVTVGSTDEFTLPVTIEKGTSNGIAAARFAFSVPSQLEFLGADKTDDHCIPAWSNNGEAPVTVDGEYIVIAEATKNGSGEDVVTFDSGTFNLKFKLAEGAAAGTYSLTMSTKYHEACDTGRLSTDGSYGDETLFDLEAKGDTSFGQVTVTSSAPVLDSSLDIPVSDLTLGIDANFYIEYYFLLDTTKYDDFKLVVSRDTYTLDSKGNYVVAKANDVEFTSASSADDVVIDAYDGESEVFCYYQGIAMYEMGLDLTAVLHVYKDGVEVAYSNPTSISFADIAKTLFNNSKGTKVKTLVTDMLILGSKAQEYFTKSGNAFDGVALPTDGFDTSLATISYGDLDNTISGSDSFDVSLLLGQAPALVFAAEIEETLNISDLAFEISYRSDLKGEDVSLNVSADDESVYSEEDTDYGYYEVAFEKIALYDTDKVITAKFIYKPGTTDERVLLEKQISLESFIGANINSAGVKAKAVYDATAKFGVSARNYFAK